VSRFGFAIAAMGLIAMVLAAPAGAGFAPAADSIASGEQLDASGVAIDAAGNSIVAWDQEPAPGADSEIRARRVAADGTLGPVIAVAPGEIGIFPVVAMTPAGRAFVAWRSQTGEPGDPDGVKGRWIEPNGALGPLLTIAEAKAGEVDAGEVRVAVDSTGVVSVLWHNNADGVLALRRVQPGGSLGATLPDISGTGVLNPQIAALPSGGTVAVWRRIAGGTGKNAVTAAGEAGTPETISVVNGIVTTRPALAFDALGNGYAVWTVQEGGTFSVRGRRLDASGAASGGELLIEAPQEAFLSATSLGIAASSAGGFVVYWARQGAGGDDTVFARSLNGAGGFFGVAQPISTAPGEVRSPAGALMDAGPAALVWRSSGEGADSTLGREVGFPSLTGGGIQPLLGAGGQNLVAGAPAIGAAAFLTEHPISGSASAAALRRFLLPPTCPAHEPVALRKEAPVAIPLSCAGAGIEGVQVTGAPRHGKVGAFDPATGSVLYTPTARSPRNDGFTFAAVSDGGASSPVTVKLKDKIRPRIRSIRLLRSKRTRKRPRIFRIRFSATEAVKPRVVVQRRLPGVLKGKRCRKPHSRAELRKGVRCVRFRKIGGFRKKGLSRRWTIRVPRKLQRQLRRGGGFRITVRGVDRARNRAHPKRANRRT